MFSPNYHNIHLKTRQKYTIIFTLLDARVTSVWYHVQTDQADKQ